LTTATFAENGTGSAYTVTATDANAVTYSLGTGNDEALFSITAGAVSFNTPPNFEAPGGDNADNTYLINVIASDGINQVSQTVTITVTDVNDPVFTSLTTATFAENGTGIAYTATATAANAVTYSLGTGNDEALFSITAGAVSFNTSPDFEVPGGDNADNTYLINVIASDGINQVSQTVRITVTDVFEIVTGIDNGEVTEADVYLYPNPASSILTIDLIKFNGLPVDIGIFDASGSEKLDIRNITDSALSLDVSNYSQGVFIIMIKSEKSLIRKKVIIKR
jgi:ribosomal protein L27